MTIRNKSSYTDRVKRIGSDLDSYDLEPLTWRERLAVLAITLSVAVITVEVIIRIGKLF